MKAILVIEVDDINRFHADVYKEDDKGNGELIMSYRSLKHMPQKKDKYSLRQRLPFNYDYRKECTYRDGWNDCLEEILGEQE